MTQGRWTAGMYVLDGSVVGTVNQGADPEDWFAYGCMNDWEDVRLGCHRDEMSAKLAVEEWVEANA